MQDRYALETEKMICNWYYGGENASPVPIFNAIQAGLRNDMQVWVAGETPDAMLRMKGDPDFIPVFTSRGALEKDNPTSAINQSLNKGTIKTVLAHRPKSHIELVQGSVVDMHVGVIVNAANTSIAFPGISTGVYGYPLKEAAKIFMLTTVEWLDAHPDVVMNVYFCCFRNAELDVYRSLTG